MYKPTKHPHQLIYIPRSDCPVNNHLTAAGPDDVGQPRDDVCPGCPCDVNSFRSPFISMGRFPTRFGHSVATCVGLVYMDEETSAVQLSTPLEVLSPPSIRPYSLNPISE